MRLNAKQVLQEIQSRTSVAEQKFELVAVTPVLVHGADKGTAEWRSSSVRGVLRYWWRAARWDDVSGAGGKVGPEPKELLKEEMTWFGGAAGEKEGRRSPVDVLTNDVSSKGKQGEASGFVQETALSLAFRLRGKADQGVRLENYAVLLDWWLLLGGIGLRSRRGYGSLARREWQWTTVDDYVQALSRVIHDWRTVGAGFASGCTIHTGRHIGCVLETSHGPTSHPTLRSVWIGKSLDKWREAVKVVGNASRVNSGSGLLGRGGKKGDRLASPLHCTVKKIGKEYVLVVAEVHTGDSQYSLKSYEDAKLQFLQCLGVSVV